MLINNSNIEDFNCKVLKFEPSPTNFTASGGFWTSSLLPIRNIYSETYRSLNITFLYTLNREDTLKQSSILIEAIKQSTIFYKNLFYDIELIDKTELVRKNSHTYILELKFNILNVYEREKSITTTSNTTININSPKECYANLEITSSNTSIISCNININNDVITVKNIKQNETIYIGSGKVLANGKSKINDVDLLEFPRLKPGINNISINQNINLTVKYNERW